MTAGFGLLLEQFNKLTSRLQDLSGNIFSLEISTGNATSAIQTLIQTMTANPLVSRERNARFTWDGAFSVGFIYGYGHLTATRLGSVDKRSATRQKNLSKSLTLTAMACVAPLKRRGIILPFFYSEIIKIYLSPLVISLKDVKLC